MIGVMGGLMAAEAVAGILKTWKGYQQNQLANKAATQYANQLAGLTEVNQLKGLKVPDLASLKSEQATQATLQATGALQGMGQEGAAQIATLNQSVLQDQAQTAQDQAKLMYERDKAVATEQSRIEQEKLARQEGLATMRLTGAQRAATEGQNNMVSGITGAITGIGDTAQGLMSTDAFEAWYKSRKA